MKLVDKKILLISPERWDHIFVSKHHYAIHLAEKGNQVIFLNPPGQKWEITDSGYTNLRVVDYPGFWRGLRFLPKWLRKKNQQTVFSGIQSLSQLNFDIIWSFDNSVFFDLDALPSRGLKISHIVDLNQNFETKRASKSADICIGVSDPIVKNLSLYNANTHLIGHGLNLQQQSEKMKLPGFGHFKALYIGNLGMRHIDWNVLANAARQCKNVDFVFVGPSEEDTKNETVVYKSEMREMSNVFFLPKINSSKVQAYLSGADVLLLSYQEKYHGDQTNSHKILEYLYSGKPIVATYTADYDGTGLLSMSKKNEEWPILLKKTVDNLSVHNERSKIERRVSHARKHSYHSRIEEIETLIY